MIYALHGFLGLPSDWNHFHPNIHPLNIYDFATPSAHSTLNHWASSFNSHSHSGILMGYSLGGRLALHALVNDPAKWKAAILISCHPGLDSPTERKTRHERDLLWAEKFQINNWDSLIKEWNSQMLFQHDVKALRYEQNHSRSILSDTLRYWSLGTQQPLLAQIIQLPMPILWIAGEKDSSYVALANSMKFSHPKSQVWIAPEVGHRVPWSCKSLFQKTLLNFLDGL